LSSVYVGCFDWFRVRFRTTLLYRDISKYHRYRTIIQNSLCRCQYMGTR